MDHTTLRSSTAEELAIYLRTYATRYGNQTVTRELLAGIEAESLPPTVYSIWLNASGDCLAVKEGLHQQFSILVQRASSTKFGTLFSGSRVEEVWNALGGTSGVVEYLSQTSVRDYKLFCYEISKTWNLKTAVETRQRFVDELYKALCPREDFSDSSIKIADQRPLAGHSIIFPACSAELVADLISGRPSTSPEVQTAIETHLTFFRQQFLATLEDVQHDIDIDRLSSLLANSSGDTSLCKGEQLGVNIAFAIDALEALSKRGDVGKLDCDTFHRILANPLFKKLWRRSTKPEFVAEIVSLYMVYIQRHVGAAGIDFFNAAVVEYVVRKWSRRPEQLEASLLAVLGLIEKAHSIDLSSVERLLKRAPWPLRLRLLELIVRHIPSLRLDINSDTDLKALPWSWSPDFFRVLPKPEARRLFERLIGINPNPFDYQETEQLYHIDQDPTYLLLLLARDDSDLLHLATEAVAQRKREANKARKQPSRSFWAQYALRCATASCSIELYRDTLQWAKRYTKDPLTAVAIYSQGELQNAASVNLLCGFAAAGEKKSKEDVEQDVKKANGICLDLFETACEAMAEPSFHSYQWQGVVGLIGSLVQIRLERVDKLQEALDLTDEEVSHIVWKDTLDVCIELERRGLEEANTRLEFNKIGGPLSSLTRFNVRAEDSSRPATLRFLDELAYRRNELWTTYRQAQRPVTLVLPKSYPRGLPFNCLIPLHLVERADHASIQYLNERAKQVVFLDAESALSALPETDEELQAVGPFVEAYQIALRYYIRWSPDKHATIVQVWRHAIGPLSNARLSGDEALSFWRPIFGTQLNALRDLRLDLQIPKDNGASSEALDSLPEPEVPVSDDVTEPIEWNPDPHFKSFSRKVRRIEPTILDVMIHQNCNNYDTLKSTFRRNFQSEIQARSTPYFWTRCLDSASPQAKEALIAAALLYISARNKQSPGLLTTAFPSEDEKRFPAMYLDGDFLDREDIAIGSHWAVLEEWKDSVPATLLLHLLENEAGETMDTLRLLDLLGESDKPQLSLSLIKHMILERPEESSWQRAVLTPGLFNSLPKETARQFLISLSSGMQEKLAEQAVRKADATYTGKPLIKVTTVKMLAQLLSGAEYIDQSSACQILIPILKAAKHIDILTSVVNSLVDIMVDTSDHAVKTMIVDALEQYIIPVASSINERSPMQEEDWLRFEHDPETMPEVYMESDGGDQLPPVLASLVNAAQKLDDADSSRFYTRVLIPVLEGSIKNNRRWLSLYCHHLMVPAIEFPSCPLRMQLITELLNKPSHIPSTLR